MISLKEQVKDMKKYCKENKYCMDKEDKLCPYREMCIDFLKNSFESRTPSKESVNRMYGVLHDMDKYCKHEDIQHFHNTQGTYKISTHPSGNYWRRLQYVYCRDRGFKIKKAWLDFQKFAEWYDIMSCDGKYSPVLDQSKNVINEDTLRWVKK